MDFVIMAKAWSAALDNPTSKHQIACELVHAGNRVQWVEGAGMRRPSLGSGQDRGRMLRKLRAARSGCRVESVRFTPHPSSLPGGLWVLAPRLVPLPGSVRRCDPAGS